MLKYIPNFPKIHGRQVKVNKRHQKQYSNLGAGCILKFENGALHLLHLIVFNRFQNESVHMNLFSIGPFATSVHMTAWEKCGVLHFMQLHMLYHSRNGSNGINTRMKSQLSKFLKYVTLIFQVPPRYLSL